MKPALVAAVMLAFAVNLAPRCEAKHTPSDITEASKKQSPSWVSASFLFIQNQPEGASSHNQSTQAEPPYWNKPPEWVLPLIGFVTAIIIIWQSWETRKAAQATQKSAAAMENQTGILEKSVSHAETSAKAAEASIDVAKDTAKRQLRAYMTIREAKVLLHEDGSVEASAKIENCGQTPAYDLEGAHFCRLESYPVERFGDPPEELRKSSSIIGAGGSFFVLANRLPSGKASIDELLDLLSSPKFVCRLNGYYSYKDIFKDRHYIRFQVIVGGPAGLRQDIDKDGQRFLVFSNDAEGNEAD